MQALEPDNLTYPSLYLHLCSSGPTNAELSISRDYTPPAAEP